MHLPGLTFHFFARSKLVKIARVVVIDRRLQKYGVFCNVYNNASFPLFLLSVCSFTFEGEIRC